MTTGTVWLLICGLGLLAAASAVLCPRWQWQRRSFDQRRALELFRLQREILEARFFDRAGASGKPRGVRWLDCDFGDEVVFARETGSGRLTAFASVQIRFEAIPGGDMEEVAAVGHLRQAVALFQWDRGHWTTAGRTLFNLEPAEALTRLESQFSPVP